MHDRVRSKAAPKDVNLRGDIRKAHVIPTTLISELSKHITRVILITKNPERNHDGEEAKDVADQTCCFELREECGAPCVERNSDNDDSPHDECDLPWCECKVWVGYVDAGLHLEGDCVAAACETGEPA